VKLNNYSIRNLLLSTALGILLIMILIGIITYIHIDNTQKHYRLLAQIDNVARCELMIQNDKKDFILRETINSTFFETGRSNYITRFDSLLQEVNKELSDIQKNPTISTLKIENDISLTINSFNEFRHDFTDLVSLIKEKGFKDYGIEGNLRRTIHLVESKLNQSNSHMYTNHMLMLRRHEKDYLLRKELKYKDQFNDRIGLFIKVLSASNTNQNHEIINLLKVYQGQFMQLIEKDIQIGLNDREGQMAKLNSGAERIEQNLVSIQSKITSYTKSSVNGAIALLFVLFGFISIVSTVIILRIARHISKSVKRLRKYVSRLGKGELPEQIIILGKDEIASMEESINVLTENLVSTREFAIEVGNGNLDKEINVFNNEGDLGGALIEMRKKLFQVSKEKERQEKEAAERNWTNEGLAIFANILRHKTNNVEDLAFNFIQNLVKYTGSNQSGLFMVNREDVHEPFIELIAAYAYERKKFVKKRLAINEGLIGMCVFEGETTIMNDIPDNYLRITSGLGDANPRWLILVPLKVDDVILGVIEMASFKEYEAHQIAFIEKVTETVASTLQTVKINVNTSKLLEQTKFQAEELAAQEEELRQNMEELQSTQESMLFREHELRDALEQKNLEIKSIEEQHQRNSIGVKKRIHALENISNVLDATFLCAEFEPNGNLIKANRNYLEQIAGGYDNENITIASGYVHGEEDVNKMEWIRIIGGESYRGIINRLNPFGETIAIYAGIFPVNDINGELDRIICIGNKIGKSIEPFISKVHGTWTKSFILSEDIINDKHPVWS